MDLTATALHLTRAIPVRVEPRSITASATFEETLHTADAARSGTPNPRAHTVRRGETLWAICRAHLRRSGLPAHDSAVADAVRRVARHNRIADPDFILPGQVFELPDLETGHHPGSAVERVAGNRAGIPGAGRVRQGGPAESSNPVSWRSRKAAMQAREALGKGLGRESALEQSASAESPFGRVLAGPAWVSSEFGVRKDPFTGRTHQHNGVDLAAPKGTEVYAFDEGRVIFSGWRGSYGRLIIVEHEDGTETRYGHLSDRLVKAGDVVSRDTLLGKVGSSGRSTGPHLHFELHRDARPVDPLPHLRQQLAQSM